MFLLGHYLQLFYYLFKEWETEILEMDLSGLSSDGDLGFELVGGRDDPHYPNDSAIYVASVTKGSIADGKLRLEIIIIRIVLKKH